ncbi:MAG: hypothetical protein Q4B67_08085 [Eubacteriales bacterium]|nr:hypothetical protein [Eubacteriales bacterium]
MAKYDKNKVRYDKHKFIYGLDGEVYLEKAFEKLKAKYHWAEKSMLRQEFSYGVERCEEDGKYHFIQYVTYDNGNVKREILDDCETTQDFIDRIVWHNDGTVFSANKVVAEYAFKDKLGVNLGGDWHLERYEFHKHETGDYSVYVQAGNRSTGGGRDFFIPPKFMTGTFEKFLENYGDLVPGGGFGVYPEDLEKDKKLKEFLGFGD